MRGKTNRVYIDTCVVGELISKATSVKREAVERIITLAKDGDIELFTSGYTKDEIEEAPKRIRGLLLQLLGEIPHEECIEDEETLYLAKRYVEDVGLTHIDAFHVATSVAKGMDIFLSFNRRTIVNEKISRKLKRLNEEMGYRTPQLVTPEEFVGKVNKEE